MKKYAYNLVFLGIFFVVSAIFFYQTIFFGKLPVPTDTLVGLYHPWRDLYASTNPRGVPYKNFLITDPVRQQIPWRKLVIDQWKQGILPLWNPYVFSGTPLLANVQSGALYPLNALFFVLPFSVAWTFLVVLQPVMAGSFLFLFFRQKEIHPIAAVMGALAWAFGGFFIAWLTWGTIDQTVLWLPLILLSTDHVLASANRARRIMWIVIFIFSMVSMIFAGHLQVALYVIGFVVAYVLYLSRHTMARRSALLWLGVGGIIAIFASAVQWFPTLQTLTQSARLGDSAAWLKDGWFLPWRHLVQFIVPDFFGNPATLNYWGTWNYGEFIGYIGMLPFIFALYSMMVRRDTITSFFGWCSFVILLFLLPTPIAKIPYQLHIPLAASLQPTRLMAILDFCLVVLSVLGFEYYLRHTNKKIFYAVFLVFVALGFLWTYTFIYPRVTRDTQLLENMVVAQRNLYFPTILWICSSFMLFLFFVTNKFLRKLLLICVISFIAFDLLRFGWKFTPFTPGKYFFPKTKTVNFLQAQERPFRVMSVDNKILPPNVSTYYGLETPEGYDPIYDARYEEFIASLNRNNPNIRGPFGFNRIITISNITSPLFPLLNVKYILSLENINNPDLELMYSEGETKTYWYKKALPRMYPVEDIVYAHSKQQVFDELYTSSFRPLKQAVVEETIDLPKAVLNPSEHVDVITTGSSHISAEATFEHDHFVVISNNYASGWRAYVDSHETRLYRVNYIFQGIIVPKGIHTIRMQYHI